MSALNKLPRVAKMALVGALLIALALVGKGFAAKGDQPIGVSSAAVTPRAGVVAKPRVTTTTTVVPPNASGRNPFARTK